DDAVDGAGLLDEVNRESFLAGRSTPLMFGAALANIGVRQLLDTIVDLAPAPSGRPDMRARPVATAGSTSSPATGGDSTGAATTGATDDDGAAYPVRPVDAPFSGFVFKMQ